MRRTVLVALMTAATLLVSGPAAPAGTSSVPSTLETVPTGVTGDTADDPAIWVSSGTPSASLVITNEKKVGRLTVLDLAGQVVQRITDPGGFYGNIDVRGDIVAAAHSGIWTWRVTATPNGPRLMLAREQSGNASTAGEGLCMWDPGARGVGGGLYAINVYAPDFRVRVHPLTDADKDGLLLVGSPVRDFRLGSEAEGCETNDSTGDLFIAEEDVGVWRYDLDAGTGLVPPRVMFAPVGPHLAPDVEGLALAGGALYASAQNVAAPRYNWYSRYDASTGSYLGSFRVTDGAASDDCDQTDGIDAYAGSLGPSFPYGIFICQDRTASTILRAAPGPRTSSTRRWTRSWAAGRRRPVGTRVPPRAEAAGGHEPAPGRHAGRWIASDATSIMSPMSLTRHARRATLLHRHSLPWSPPPEEGLFMHLKRTLAVAAALALALPVAACGSGSSPTKASGGGGGGGGGDFGDCKVTSKKGSISIKPAQAGTLTVETTLPAQGWWNGTTPSSIKSGYEYCLAANLANMAGLKSVTVKNVSFAQLVAGRTNVFDLALAEISITPERAKVVDFSTPYYDSNIGVLVQKGSGVTEDNINSKKCAAYAGTTSVPFIQNKLSCDTKIYPNSQTLYQGLLSGQVDADFLDTAIVLAEAKATGGKLEVVGQYKTGEKYGAIYPKNSPNEDALNEGIQKLIDDGTTKQLSKTYLGPAFGGDPASVPIWTVK